MRNLEAMERSPIDDIIGKINTDLQTGEKVTMAMINKELDRRSITDQASRSKFIWPVADYFFDKNKLEWFFDERPSRVKNSAFSNEAKYGPHDQ